MTIKIKGGGEGEDEVYDATVLLSRQDSYILYLHLSFELK
jgi:hypothetical protein